MADMNDFYEPDEPLDEVLRAFEAGRKGVTAPPHAAGRTENLAVGTITVTRGWTKTLDVPSVVKLVSKLTTVATPPATAH